MKARNSPIFSRRNFLFFLNKEDIPDSKGELAGQLFGKSDTVLALVAAVTKSLLPFCKYKFTETLNGQFKLQEKDVKLRSTH